MEHRLDHYDTGWPHHKIIQFSYTKYWRRERTQTIFWGMLKTPKTTVNSDVELQWVLSAEPPRECAQPQQQISHVHIWTVTLCAELPGLTVEPDTRRHWQNTESRVAQIYKVFPSNLACLAAGTRCRQSFPCQPSWSVHRVHTVASLLMLLMPSLCLPWHFTHLMKEKNDTL